MRNESVMVNARNRFAVRIACVIAVLLVVVIATERWLGELVAAETGALTALLAWSIAKAASPNPRLLFRERAYSVALAGFLALGMTTIVVYHARIGTPERVQSYRRGRQFVADINKLFSEDPRYAGVAATFEPVKSGLIKVKGSVATDSEREELEKALYALEPGPRGCTMLLFYVTSPSHPLGDPW
jgi:hypothetical protein